MIRRGLRGPKAFLPWSAVSRIDPQLMFSPNSIQLAKAPEHGGKMAFLREEVLDKQIVDTFGAKVVRVNDLRELLVHPEETAKDAALSLAPLAGSYCTFLFAFGLVNASLFAASILPLSTTYLICEGLGWETGIDKKFVEAPEFYGFYSLMIFLGAGIILMPGMPLITIMYVSQVINGMVLPVVLIFILLRVNDRNLMQDHTNGPVFQFMSAWLTTGGNDRSNGGAAEVGTLRAGSCLRWGAVVRL